MPIHERVEHSGVIGDVFAHRFVLEMKSGNVLADLGPKGAEQFRLRTGDRVHIEGEQAPSEVKVRSIARSDGKSVIISHPKHRNGADKTDTANVLRALEVAGFEAIGNPRRKRKHFEVQARNSRGSEVPLHVRLDGRIRKLNKMLAA